MADYNLNAEITADASGFESGIKKAQKASKNLSNSVSSMIKGLGKNGLVGALGAVGLASGGVSAILGTSTKVAKHLAKHFIYYKVRRITWQTDYVFRSRRRTM